MRSRLARVDLTTGELDLTWAPTANGTLYAMTVSSDGTRLFFGGSFVTVSGVSRAHLGAVSTSGSGAVVTTRVASANAGFSAMFVKSGPLYAAGSFSSLSGAGQAGVARSFTGAVTEATGVLDPTFRPDISAPTIAATPSLDGNTVLIDGRFTTVGGVARPYLASVDAVTGALSTWSPAPACNTIVLTNPCYVIDIVAKGTSVFSAVGGPGGGWPTTTPQRERSAGGSTATATCRPLLPMTTSST